MFEISEELMKKELKVIPSTGFYKNEEVFIKEAINTLLATRKDLRITIACELYERPFSFHFGYLSFVKTTPGFIKTLSPIFTPEEKKRS